MNDESADEYTTSNSDDLDTENEENLLNSAFIDNNNLSRVQPLGKNYIYFPFLPLSIDIL